MAPLQLQTMLVNLAVSSGMGLSGLRSPSRQRHKRSDKYQESRAIPAEMDKNYPVGRRESHAYEKSATALSVGIPRHNASAFGGGRMSSSHRISLSVKSLLRSATISFLELYRFS